MEEKQSRSNRNIPRPSKQEGQFQLAGRMLPHSIDAEEAVLGALFLDTEAIMKIADTLRAEDFYRPEHEAIYSAISTLFERHQPIDLVTVSEELSARKKFEMSGGAAKLSALVSGIASATNVVYHAGIVRQKSLLRKLISASNTIGELGFHEDKEAAEVLDEAEKTLFGVTQRYLKQNFVSVRAVLDESFERLGLLASNDGGLRGVPMGFRQMDRLMGGLQKSDLIILAARPSMGKTTFALNIAENVALQQKKTVGIFSLEMSKEQLVDKMLSSLSQVDSWKLRNGNLNEEDMSQLIEAQAELAEAKLFIEDSAGASIMEVRTKARRLMSEHGLDLLVIDYLQLMSGSATKSNSENRVQEVSEISRSLKALAKELNVPIIALSQLSRAVEARNDKRPMLSDLRESGSIEQDADVVMFLYRDDYYNKNKEEHNHLVEVLVSKHRNGPTGDVRLSAQLQHSRFFDLDPRQAQQLEQQQ
jgi:replicative DNA helicase